MEKMAAISYYSQAAGEFAVKVALYRDSININLPAEHVQCS